MAGVTFIMHMFPLPHNPKNFFLKQTSNLQECLARCRLASECDRLPTMGFPLPCCRQTLCAGVGARRQAGGTAACLGPGTETGVPGGRNHPQTILCSETQQDSISHHNHSIDYYSGIILKESWVSRKTCLGSRGPHRPPGRVEGQNPSWGPGGMPPEVGEILSFRTRSQIYCFLAQKNHHGFLFLFVNFFIFFCVKIIFSQKSAISRKRILPDYYCIQLYINHLTSIHNTYDAYITIYQTYTVELPT